MNPARTEYGGIEYEGEMKAIEMNDHQVSIDDDSCPHKLEVAPATGQNPLNKE